MPKQKTRKSVVNRFKITKNGKVMRGHSFSKHLKVGKSRKSINRRKKQVEMTGFYARKIRKLLGVTLKTK